VLDNDRQVEVARLTVAVDGPPAAARGTEHSRTITFDSDSLTIMIRVDANADGTARVDGWLAPPQCRQVDLRAASDTLSAVSDENGRFAFGQVPRGTVQLVVRAGPDRGLDGRAVVTPILIL
jgi:hypothetical protein